MKKILVVDNNKVILRMLTHILEEMGHKVVTAENGFVALEVIASVKPDLMFVDLVMPIISGEKLCKAVREMPQFDSVPIVVISAIAAEEKVDFASFGADACIAKSQMKTMGRDILTVIEHLDNGRNNALASRIFGSENVFERGITTELLANKKHLEVALNNMADGFVELTVNGNIIFTNENACNLFKINEEKVLGLSFVDLFPKALQPIVSDTFRKLNGSVIELGEDTPIQLHGNFLNLKFVSYIDCEQKFIIVIIQDISRRKLAEIRVTEYQDKLEQIVRERTTDLEEKNIQLQVALDQVKTLSGLLPMCCSCKSIRDDDGYWNKIEHYISKNSDAIFSHGICPGCAKKLYPEYNLHKKP